MITSNVVKYLNGLWRNIPQNRFAKLMSTANIEKIEHFSAMKSFWWDKNGPLKGLHNYTTFKTQIVKNGLNSGVEIQNSDLPLKGINIVEVGCGGGILTESLARAGAQVTGIDVSAELINVAKEHIKLDPSISKRVNYIHTTVEDFAQKERENSAYDAVVTTDVLQYVTDQELFLKECVKLLKPGKSIFITTINKTLMSWLCFKVAGEFIFRSIPFGVFDWGKFIAPHEVQCILKNYGCETKSIRGMKFNPMTRHCSWSSNVFNLYGLHAIKQKEIV
ncbi:PREDICTED: ubiquinone biosynthesis O-methyltransferase-like [Cyphomyrmex costatus]|uniref:ubiquinone biosynthesis O-methyltransferase-like n=1 Tax=Cyphomyrmex costatus TaxID=456900 RepID=UPI0008522C5F|nr:PREDICTED: ubiquinone biosynthesis O-methyltransferase-like [Cyphomyrmex costatus]